MTTTTAPTDTATDRVESLAVRYWVVPRDGKRGVWDITEAGLALAKPRARLTLRGEGQAREVCAELNRAHKRGEVLRQRELLRQVQDLQRCCEGAERAASEARARLLQLNDVRGEPPEKMRDKLAKLWHSAMASGTDNR